MKRVKVNVPVILKVIDEYNEVYELEVEHDSIYSELEILLDDAINAYKSDLYTELGE